MKCHRFSCPDCSCPGSAAGRGRVFASSRSGARPAQAGVALIVTLILLSIITFMTVAFLVISRSQKGAVTTTTDTTIARLAADTGVERAKSEMAARVLGFTNPFNFELVVSTNFINPRGFIAGNRSFTNVSYTMPGGAPVSGNNALENLSHLLYNPRVPVVITNPLYQNSNDFRYYLDLNRNAKYDTNGVLPVIGPNGGFLDTNGVEQSRLSVSTLSNLFVGDPEWIGVLERPDLPHSPSNRFVSRFAYIVVPASKTLDVNYVHNYSKLARSSPAMPLGGSDGFMRDQGVGTWEMNLAAFLVDLNTNYWPYPANNANGTAYRYQALDQTMQNEGMAFSDAFSLLRYRYNGSAETLATLGQYFGNQLAAITALELDHINSHGLGVTLNVWPVDDDVNRLGWRWAGSDNANHFFTAQEFFDKTKISLGTLPSFPDRLRAAGAGISSYDRYTYYRMLAQLGTDSSYDQPSGKINLNYDNQVRGRTNNVGFTKYVSVSSTNFIPWRPVDFFHAAADKLLSNAGYDPASVTNPPASVSSRHIQLWPTNFYTASVHRMLQLAANIYDATTNRTYQSVTASNGFPTVFRPLFGQTNGIIFIAGFDEVTNASQVLQVPRWLDLNNPQDRRALVANDMIYGVPLIIGAKKGFPNFNEFAMQTAVQVTRKLEFRRRDPRGPVTETNQMLTVGISNVFGLEAWNSYSNAYPRTLQLRVALDMSATMTNEFGQVLLTNFVLRTTTPAAIDMSASSWKGWVNPNYATASFLLPFTNNQFAFLNNSVYRSIPRRFVSPVQNIAFERPSFFHVPNWTLLLRTRLRYMLLDTSVQPPRIVDYVNLDGQEAPINIGYELARDGVCKLNDASDGSMWCTNRPGDQFDPTQPTFGILNQIAVGLDLVKPLSWNSFQTVAPAGLDVEGAIDFFRAQYGLGPHYYQGTPFSKTNLFYAPLAASRTLYFNTSWQANDPLVHYTIGDLIDYYDNFTSNRITFYNAWSTNGLGGINRRYEPWGGNPIAGSASPYRMDLAVKDPLVTRSDDWDFPTNKFPNVGWLGRVHRGTPWQTVDLKSKIPTFAPGLPGGLEYWQKWSGHGTNFYNRGQFKLDFVPFNGLIADATFSHPIQDRYILDLFTTSLNENATRGQLSVNQTNVAAWSAVLSGVSVLTNATPTTNRLMFIEPAGTYLAANPPPLARIVQGIARGVTNYTSGVYRRVGDVLAVPELTVASPFINTNANIGALNDAAYERIPQQVMGLLKGADEPRFVIYSYGQALKPADRSLVVGGSYAGLCTNYQITAEVATRTVVRFEGLPKYPSSLVTQWPLTNARPVIETFNILPPE